MNRVNLYAFAGILMLAAVCLPSGVNAADSPGNEQLQRVVSKLKQMNPKFDGQETHLTSSGQVIEFQFSSSGVTDISPLSEFTALKQLVCKGYSHAKTLANLSPLRGLPLTELDCSDTQVSDLAPLSEMPLETLRCTGTRISDLSPLKSVPLRWLDIRQTHVSDLAPLSKCPLRYLNCTSTRVVDFSSLNDVPLEELYCDLRNDSDRLAVLRIRTLKKLNGRDVTEMLADSAPPTTKGGKTARPNARRTSEPNARKASEPKAARAPALNAGGTSEPGDRGFARIQSSIKGLYVMRLGNGQRVGGAQDIIATAERESSKRESTCEILADAAANTKISMNEAARLLRVRYPVWPPGHKIRFSYADKYSKQAGGSAGGAFSVLLLSLLEGFQIDPGFAMTGDVTVDGKIRKVGAVAEKIRGAILEKCTAVAIPWANREDVADLTILYSPSMLWSIQILSINTLDDAAAVARLDKAPNMSSALMSFNQIQRTLGPNGSVSWLQNQNICTALQQVLQQAPNHLSAEFMLKAASNQLSSTLSLSASLEEIWAASAAMKNFLFNDKTPDAKQGETYKVTKLPAETVKVALDRLSWLESRLHPKTRDFRNAMNEFIVMLDTMRRQGSSSSATYSQWLAKRDKVLGEITKLGTDRKTLEELMH